MKKLLTLLLLSTVLLACRTQKNIHCVIETDMGNIGIELYPKKAPITVGNFMTYVDKQLYNNSSFFRVCTPQNEADRSIKIEVIQGGNVPENQQLDSIALETTNKTKLLHKNGALSMARGGPQSATSEFFICINNQPELNFGGKRNPDGQGFAAFGQVTSGMEVVKKIQSQPDNKQYLLQPIVINPSSVCGTQLFRLSKQKNTYLCGMQLLSKQVKGNTYYDLGITVREEQKVKKKVDVFGQPK